MMKESNAMKEYAGTYKLYNNEDMKTIFLKNIYQISKYTLDNGVNVF